MKKEPVIKIRKREIKNIRHFINMGINPFLAQLLLNRGIRTEQEAEKYLKGSVNDLYDPALIRNIEVVTEIVSKAIDSGKKIYVFGDYDADGITASAIMCSTLKDLGADVAIRLPDRLTEGYGMSAVAVEELRSKGCEVIITVDNGIRSHHEIALAKKYGMEVIVLDHHVPPESLPEADTIVDLHIPGETYPFKELAGCGLAFKVACHLYREFGFGDEGLKHLDLAAIGTIADVVPLVDENRIIVKEGLNLINSSMYDRIGVIELMNCFGVELGTLSSTDIGFKIAPALNAPGRLLSGGAELAVKLLLCEDNDEAVDYAYQLFAINEERKSITTEYLAKAEDYIAANHLENDKVMVVFIKDIPEGIVGLISGKITEKYNRPSLVFCETKEYYKGSARSIEAFNLYEALYNTCDDLFVKYGGHAQAAGMSLEKDQEILSELRKRLNEYADKVLPGEALIPIIEVDDVLNEDDINFEFIKMLQALEPCGEANPKPIFMLKDFRTQKKLTQDGWMPYVYLGENEDHLKLYGSGWEAIGFGMAGKFKELGEPRNMDIVFTLGINHFRGNKTIQLELVDLRTAEQKPKSSTELMNAISDALANLNSFQVAKPFG